MFFKLIYTIKPLHLRENEKIDFVFHEKECIIKVEMERIPKDELNPNSKKGELKCIARAEKLFDEKIRNLFANIDNEVPSELKKLIYEISNELSNFIVFIIHTYRWKLGIANSYSPILTRSSLFWSFDKELWKHLPSDLRLVVDWGLPMKKVTPSELTILQELVTNKINEPLGHELFVEAWELRKSNPRSSLVIGIAAAEAGFRECVSILIPDATWLIGNVPSPPLVTMLKKYLPLLPCKKKIWGKIISPPKEIMKIIDEGVKNRNGIAHGKSSKVDSKFLEEFLRTIRDLLYLLDYYNGHEWAWGNISPETKTLLVADAKRKP